VRKRLLAILLAAVLALSSMVFTGCGKEDGSKAQRELTRVQLCEVVHSIFYAPQYVAISQGFFEEEGLEIELTTAQGSDKVLTALLSNTADVGLAGSEAGIYVYNQGQEDYAVSFAQLTRRDGSFLVGRNPEPEFKWENLKGKTIIGGRPGGMPEMVLEYVLKKHGLTPGKDVEIITNLAFTATAGAFKGGTGDYVALFEPTASLLEREGAGYVVSSLGRSSGEVPYTVFMVRKSMVKENPELVQKFTNAVYRGQRWVNSHSASEVARVIQPFFPDADLDLITRVVARYQEQDTWPITPLVDEDSFLNMQDIIRTAGELDKTVEPSALIIRDFARKAVDSSK